MAIGNPITLTSNVASKTISVIATAGQTLFTVTGGYRINQLAVFRNGVRLLDSRDYEARNGSTVTLLSAATVGDALEFQVFDDFRVADAIVSAESEQTIQGNLTVAGILTATNLSVTDLSLRHLKATGISTVSDTTQSTSTTTGAFIVSGGVGIAKSLYVGGDVSVGGTISYEDVTNVDSVGVITARSGINITGGDLTIPDAIIHSSDTNTRLRFPATDTFTVETAGNEALRVDSDGHFMVGQTSPYTATGAGNTVATFTNSGNYRNNLAVSNQTNGTDSGAAVVLAAHGNDWIIEAKGLAKGQRSLAINSGSTEALRVNFNGNVGIGTTIAGGKLQIDGGELLVGTKTVKGVASTTDATAIFRDDGGAHTIIAVESSAASGGGTIALSANRNNSDSGFTILQNNDVMGEVRFAGSDGTDLQTYGARITAEVDGTPASNNMPGRLEFHTNSGGSSTTERLRISANGNIGVGGIAGDKPLHVRADGEDYPLLLQNRTNSTSTCGMALIATGSDFSDGQFASIEALSGGVGSTQHELQFRTSTSGGTPTNRFTIRHDGNVRIPADNVKLQIGASEDFELYHDGTDNVIQTDGPNIRIGTSGESYAKFVNNGAVELYHDNSKMFETTSTGALVQRPSGDVSLSIGDTSNSEGHLVLTAKSSSIELHGRSNHPINILFNTVQKASIGIDGTISDHQGPLRRITYKQETSAYTLVAADAGKAIEIQGNLTVPNSVFAAGDAITIINDSSSNKTISKGTGLSYMFNTADGTNANRTLGGRGMATIYFVNSTTCYISGSQLS